MGKFYPIERRMRVQADVESGQSRRAAALRYAVSASHDAGSTGGCAVTSQDELRKEAAAPGMSLPRDRASLLEAARRYEAEASELEVQADAMDARPRQDDHRRSVPDGEIGPRKR
jgi:hypothetical protein